MKIQQLGRDKIFARYKIRVCELERERRKRRRYKAKGTILLGANSPNGLWCADYKGEFMLGNEQYCYPLTITDRPTC